MLDRRALLALAWGGGIAAANLTIAWPNAAAAAVGAKRLLLVHGRDQQGQDPAVLQRAWLDALSRGARPLGRALPPDVQVAFPFYGDVLDDFARRATVPLTPEIRTRGDASVDRQFLEFQAAIAGDLSRAAGISEQQIEGEYDGPPAEKGPENWRWVQAIIRAIDKYGHGISQSALEILMRDVFLYTTRAGVRDEIDRIVRAELTMEPTIVIGHSLGSVVTYNILRTDPRALAIPLYLTVGSPLGIRAIREELRPLRFPPHVRTWYNARDTRDTVALYPLDANNFPVSPAVENYSAVRNDTDNRHGIAGYLDDSTVAARILAAIGA